MRDTRGTTTVVPNRRVRSNCCGTSLVSMRVSRTCVCFALAEPHRSLDRRRSAALPPFPPGRRSSRGGDGEGFRRASQEGSPAATGRYQRRKWGFFADEPSSRAMILYRRIFALFSTPPPPRIYLSVQPSGWRVGCERERFRRDVPAGAGRFLVVVVACFLL